MQFSLIACSPRTHTHTSIWTNIKIVCLKLNFKLLFSFASKIKMKQIACCRFFLLSIFICDNIMWLWIFFGRIQKFFNIRSIVIFVYAGHLTSNVGKKKGGKNKIIYIFDWRLNCKFVIFLLFVTLTVMY